MINSDEFLIRALGALVLMLLFVFFSTGVLLCCGKRGNEKTKWWCSRSQTQISLVLCSLIKQLKIRKF